MNNKFTFTIGEFHANESGVDIKDANVSVENEATPEETTKSIEALNRALPEIKKMGSMLIETINTRHAAPSPQLTEAMNQMNQTVAAVQQQAQMMNQMFGYINQLAGTVNALEASVKQMQQEEPTKAPAITPEAIENIVKSFATQPKTEKPEGQK